jgi:heat shock protein 4
VHSPCVNWLHVLCLSPQIVSATQCLAMLLTHLMDIGRKELNAPKLTDCVIGVPCYFNDRQRHAMLEAAEIAGIHCLSLLNETAAVALGYGIYRSPQLPSEEEISSGAQKARRVIFVDVGHSQIQMSVCDMMKGKLTVLATASERVGGRDFDRVLFDHFNEEFKEKCVCLTTTSTTTRLR